jgi:hypothetical protein
LDIPPYSSLQSAREGGLSPTAASPLFSPHLPMDLQNPPLDHRPPPEPRYPDVYVTFGAGMLQKEIDMHTTENPVGTMESPDGTVRLIPYHVPTYVHPRVSVPQIVQAACLCRPALHTLRDRRLWLFGFLSRSHGLIPAGVRLQVLQSLFLWPNITDQEILVRRSSH